MQTNHFFSKALCFALIALLFALGAPTAAPVASAESAPALLQFTAGGHVVGFAPTQVILAAFDHALRVEFVGTAGVTPAANAAAAASGAGRTAGAPPLGVVTYPDLWRGVSVEYRASEAGILKSTYTVAPGADVAQIRLRYNVPVQVQRDGSLQFAFGRGFISESAPLAWQEIDGARVPVPVAFYLPSLDTGEGGEVAFRLGAYNPRYPLTIDPNYVWHTFYGSSSVDYGYGIAVDGSGNVYITGYSYTTWQGDGGVNPLHAHSGNYDIVVVKLTSAGAYQWHTFYGSSSYDSGNGIAVDGSNNVYITGYSEATWQGEGASPDPLHAHSTGNNWDIVVVKLTSAGAYQWHTFYGSSSYDSGDGIAVDGSNNVYITGYSNATWLGEGASPNPLHAYSGGYEIVALKLTSAGAYGWHTFYGSSSDDYGRGIAVDGGGNVYITGYSNATWQGDGNTNPLHAHSGSSDIVALKLGDAPPQFSLNLTKSVGPSSAKPGEAITYTITFSNSGAITATNVLITDTLPAPITNPTWSSSGVLLTLIGGQTYAWSAPNLGPGAGGVITVTGVLTKPLTAGVFTNTVTLAVSGTVKVAEAPLTVLNVAPVADAGVDQTVGLSQAVTLHGSGTDDNGDALTYGWTQTGGPAVTLSNPAAQSPTFTAPSTAGVLTFTLTVTDTGGLSDTDEVVITASAGTPGYASTPTAGSVINAGGIKVGVPVTTTLTISETGNATLNVTSLILSGPNATEFSVSPASFFIVNGGAAQTVNIVCTPASYGLRTATLTVNHNAAGSPAVYTLNCTGIFINYLPIVLKNSTP